MEWYIWLAIILGAIIAIYILVAICMHICRYGTYRGKEPMLGKTVFITGGTSGIGKVTAISLFLRGAKVAFTGRSVKGAHNTVNELAEKLRKCKLFLLVLMIFV